LGKKFCAPTIGAFCRNLLPHFPLSKAKNGNKLGALSFLEFKACQMQVLRTTNKMHRCFITALSDFTSAARLNVIIQVTLVENVATVMTHHCRHDIREQANPLKKCCERMSALYA
jgi:hypothetical protein